MGLPSCNEVSSILSDDMLVEIVTRLPVKSFSRSKCVSKSWRSLLSNDYVRSKLPLIVSGVLQPSNSTGKNGPVYVTTGDANLVAPTGLDFFPFRLNSTLIDCCNGLLLFYSTLTASFHVCNPTTKKYVSLPKPARETMLSVLAFDPCRSRHFKVVNFTGWHDHSADIELYDSQSGTWATRQVDWGLDTNALSATMRYMDGVLYILAQPKQVVAVDLSDNMACSLIELPENAKRECCLGKVGGKLHYSAIDGNRMRVWMLRDEGEGGGWMLKHCVCINKMGQIRVLGLDPLRDLVYLWVKGELLVAYDVGEERVEAAWKLGEEEKGYLIQVWVFPFSSYMEDCLANSL